MKRLAIRTATRNAGDTASITQAAHRMGLTQADVMWAIEEHGWVGAVSPSGERIVAFAPAGRDPLPYETRLAIQSFLDAK